MFILHYILTQYIEDKKRLEMSLDSEICYLKLYKDEVEKIIPQPRIYPVRYSGANFNDSTAFRNVCLKLFNDIIKQHPIHCNDEIEDNLTREYILKQYIDLKHTLYDLGSDAFIVHIDQLISNTSNHNKIECQDDNEKVNMGQVCESLRNIQKSERIDKFPKRTTKLNQLFIILRSLKPDEKTILFIDRRISAFVLASLIEKEESLKSNIYCKAIVGHDKPGESSSLIRLSPKEQQIILSRFRKEIDDDGLNLLVSTSVLEEGIDVAACNSVIRFDMYKNFTSYVQSRGRARAANSKYYIFFNQNDAVQLKNFENREIYEKTMKEEHQMFIDPLDQEQDIEAYVVQSTGAKLTLTTSISILHQFCSKLSDNIKPIIHITPNGDGEYRCSVRFPPLSADLHREFVGLSSNKKESKQRACYEACKELHRLGYLNDNLLLADSKKANHFEQKYPEFNKPTQTTLLQSTIFTEANNQNRYSYKMTIKQGEQNFNEPIYIEMFKDFGASVKFLIDNREDNLIKLHCLLERQQSPSALPVSTTHSILMRLLNMPFDDEKCRIVFHDTPNLEPSQRITILTTKYNNAMYLLSGESDLLPSSPFDGKIKEQKASSYEEYYKLKWKLTITQHNQKLFYAKKRAHSKEQVVLVPEFCEQKKLNVTQKQLYSFKFAIDTVFPAFAKHLVTTKFIEQFDFDKSYLTSSLIPQALTPLAASKEFNNDRLEFLGDSILKLITTVHLYRKFPGKLEGYLDYQRMRLINNPALFQIAKSEKMEQFIHAARKDDIAKTIFLGTDCQVSFAGKRLADIIEALIGGFFLERGMKGVSDLLSKLEHLNMVDLSWWKEKDFHIQAQQKPGIRLQNRGESCQQFLPSQIASKQHQIDPSSAETIEEAIGYNFKNKNLLDEAITHPSAATEGYSYQRLEFLGDAVLDFLVTFHIFCNYPNDSAGKMTLRRSNAVCNNTLARLALKLGLVKDLRILGKEIRRLISNFEDESKVDEFASAPKELGDVYEAMVGAVFVDTGFNLQTVERVFCVAENVPENATEHPYSALLNLLQKHHQLEQRNEKIYKCTFREGLHEVTIRVQGRLVATAKHKVKATAFHKAAREALAAERLRLLNK